MSIPPVPKLRFLDDGSLCVIRWGQVQGALLRPGDRVVLGAPVQGRLVVLVPRGLGSPMLGRQTSRGLRAEPGDVPASPQRWLAEAGVVAVERELGRGDLGSGERVLAVRIRPCEGATIDLEGVRALLQGGRMSRSELAAMELRAAMAPERLGVEVALGIAATPRRAAAMAESAPWGCMWVELEEVQEEQGRVIPGPWAEDRTRPRWACRPMDRVDTQPMQLGLFGDSRSA